MIDISDVYATVEIPEFRLVNTIVGNIKTALRSTHHLMNSKYAQRYRSQFKYRFNRRYDLTRLVERLVYMAVQSTPLSERLLKIDL